MDRGSSDGRSGFESRWSEIFRTRSDRPCGSPNRLYNGTGSFPGVKRLGRGVNESFALMEYGAGKLSKYSHKF